MDAKPGKSYPLGAEPHADGVNFSVYSKSAERVGLLLFDGPDDVKPAETILLDPVRHETYHYWHAFVPGVKPGQIYGYRVVGPDIPEKGHRFNSDKVLFDPYGRGLIRPKGYNRLAACKPGKNAASAIKSVVVDLNQYDWEGDAPLQRPFAETIIYEMHVGGFTRNPNSGVALEKRGTFLGLIEKIPYLKSLGITAVELLPVFQFDEADAPIGLMNYWGYSPLSFFAPHDHYSTRSGDPMAPINEFRDMIKALHRAGIEVILDVVFNHTAEGNHEGPTLCYRGFENSAYYLLEEKDKSHYSNFSGCGNTLNANHPIVRHMIVDSLKYWVSEMHVDGFRFDLASVLARDEKGRPHENPPIIWDIETDPVLSGVKLIAEAWDAAGLYQVGSFAGETWKEWNGKFRDDIRGFLKSDPGSVQKIPPRLLASPDLYGHKDQEPEQSVNFVTCHDGFTLNDLVSYNTKHNEANRESNQDGCDQNVSWNCGIEGPTKNKAIEKLRNRQVKNFFTLNLLALGTPMLLMGDEVRRTQHGNNNTYCQDNEINWFDWSLLKKHRDVLRFVKKLIVYRESRLISKRKKFMSLNQLLHNARIEWHGVKVGKPDFDYDSHSLAVTVWSLDGIFAMHVIMNSYWEPLDFELPGHEGFENLPWLRWIDTSKSSPEDIVDFEKAPVVVGPTYRAEPRSIVALFRKQIE